MRVTKSLLPLVLIALGVAWWQHSAVPTVDFSVPEPGTPTVVTPTRQRADLPATLPSQAQDTLRAMDRGGPFGYRQDVAVFGNYEGRLLRKPRSYYHEYTVETPGAPSRGVRRIITGGSPPAVYYCTGDHYRSSHRVECRS